jgi:hypothetical protein
MLGAVDPALLNCCFVQDIAGIEIGQPDAPRPPLPSGAATRAPKLKSKRNPSGPRWVGSSAGGGKCGFCGDSAAPDGAPVTGAPPAAEATGAIKDTGLLAGAGPLLGLFAGWGPGFTESSQTNLTKEPP